MSYDVNFYMQEALKLAKISFSQNEIPVGAVIVKDKKIIGFGWNKTIQNNDCSAHAEIQAIRNASAKIGNYRLNNCQLFTTLEPCLMCAGTLINSRISHVHFGTSDKKYGALGGVIDIQNVFSWNHKIIVSNGTLQEECKNLLQNFFAKLRTKQKDNIYNDDKYFSASKAAIQPEPADVTA